jgi:N-acyl-D-aspartate/D-glutamate deacylase
MSLAALRAGIRWEFESLPEYLDMLERRGAALNLACFAGHSSIRTYVMGAAASERAATSEEILQMKQLLLGALRAGAIGLSSTTSPAHNGDGGRPMPSRLAEEAELRALVSCLRETGRGLFMLTKGGQTRVPFLESLAAESGRPVVIAALLHSSTNPNAVFEDLQKIKEANDRGHRLLGAVSCCPLSMEFTMHSPYVLEGLESWKPALPLKGEAFKAKLRDKTFRAAVRAEIAKPAHFRIFNGEWDKVRVIESQRTIAELAAGRDPLDTMLDLALAENLDTQFTALLLNSDEAAVGKMLNHPCSLVSLSDAGAHLTFFNDAGFGLHLLGHWVRELGVLTLPDAVRRLTSHPAKVFGIERRGTLEPGRHADLLLFDPAKVGRGPVKRTFDLPAGEPRLTAQAVGVHGVWVNGTRIVDEKGKPLAAALPGRLLRHFSA